MSEVIFSRILNTLMQPGDFSSKRVLLLRWVTIKESSNGYELTDVNKKYYVSFSKYGKIRTIEIKFHLLNNSTISIEWTKDAITSTIVTLTYDSENPQYDTPLDVKFVTYILKIVKSIAPMVKSDEWNIVFDTEEDIDSSVYEYIDSIEIENSALTY